ncbi:MULTISPECIES: helix-turn-helix domain-containing protein [unclassified Streptomyces]|uniref:helix-turn-helix domain-containing protein n=1 Tax=unclassified Streptomyces TaxID=2593676 RepID=UPI002252254C|nr:MULTISPECIES: helix-turn-helix domain-containing protein [unclassified Streptomyces]WSP55759.1 helix-turn-helix domain-containing protein [Streptomyces sp. NBC_01241]WSU23504.1 helix-turn-helix domain-containing protein [Streptomyces sp. NBC_01108]MCX4787467.1 helix-turn-helix domain-containing protein [Streptomyces sp. NBC_01221]MCX4796748.1 helix-turn-helix domain-containing protein [Streptomyces sp. NBC_01242]WSJ37974.1 helix-turn-helix domain-containing protein [Streptomyces sp. NBC_013
MPGPRRDTRGIVDAPELFAQVRFRRREPAPGLRPYLEHYWLIDWDLPEPYVSHLVPHPSVNLVFQRYGTGGGPRTGEDHHGAGLAEISGIGLELFTQKLEGRGRVCGVQFRPGGFHPFAPNRPVSAWTGRRLPADEVFTPPAPPSDVLDPVDEDARVAALDAYLLALGPEPDPQAERAMALADLIRTDRTVRRVDELARVEGLSSRSLQRLFATYVGVGPKWVILRYRIHEALERAASDPEVDWAALAVELGYSDQAHLVRDFTATVGVPPTSFAPH